MQQPKARRCALRPFKVVEQRPHKVASHDHAVLHGARELHQVLLEIADALEIVSGLLGALLAQREAVLCDHNPTRRPVPPLHPLDEPVDPERCHVPPEHVLARAGEAVVASGLVGVKGALGQRLALGACRDEHGRVVLQRKKVRRVGYISTLLRCECGQPRA